MATKIMNAIKTKAAEVGKAKAAAGKAKEAAQAAAAYKKQDAQAKSAAPNFGAGKVFNTPKSASNPAKDKAAEANSPYNKAPTQNAPAAKPVAKPAMPSRPMGGMGARAGATRPAMTPQVKQGLQGLSDKLRAMPMKKGGATKAKKK